MSVNREKLVLKTLILVGVCVIIVSIIEMVVYRINTSENNKGSKDIVNAVSINAVYEYEDGKIHTISSNTQ